MIPTIRRYQSVIRSEDHFYACTMGGIGDPIGTGPTPQAAYARWVSKLDIFDVVRHFRAERERRRIRGAP